MRVIWAPRAIQRVSEVARYIAPDRPAAARRWVRDLFARAAAPRHHARLGRKVPELNRDDIRQLRHGAYRIISRIDPKRVVVLTIHTMRANGTPTKSGPPSWRGTGGRPAG